MKTKILMAYLALLISIISFSEAGIKEKPECCKKRKECCAKNAVCCKEQTSKKEEDCCDTNEQCCENRNSEKVSLDHYKSNNHKNKNVSCCQ